MVVFFPSVCPTSRRFTAGRFPTRRFNSISGAGTTRLYGSKAFDSQLQLEFVVDDASAKEIFDNYYEAKGPIERVILFPTVTNGNEDLFGSLNPEYLEWRWANEPVIESLQPNLSRVSVNLVCRLEIEP